jgi:trigger factor
MMHQMGHVLEQQRMSMDQYLMLIKKSQSEYLESIKPDAEKRVKQQLVLDAVIKKEEINVAVEEIESLFRLYAQMGQNLPQTEQQVRSIATSLQREKAISRLLELTTDPDPDAELAAEDDLAAVEEESSEEHADEAAKVAAAEASTLEGVNEEQPGEVAEAEKAGE